MRSIRVGTSTLELVEGDITQQDTEAIVNAANTSLRGGGGVDGAIHRAGGPQILAECKKIGGCPTGEARNTTGGRLKAKWAIHTVGPVDRDGQHGEPELLASAHRNSLRLASEKGFKTVAFPSISTGAYGYPMDEAGRIGRTTVIEYLKTHPEIPWYDSFSSARRPCGPTRRYWTRWCRLGGQIRLIPSSVPPRFPRRKKRCLWPGLTQGKAGSGWRLSAGRQAPEAARASRR